MRVSSRFTIALHIFAGIDTFEKDFKVTSELLASSVNVNPVVIRRILQQLKSAGLIRVARGSGGAAIAKPIEEITFLDIYKAVENAGSGEMFRFHENPSMECPVGRNIHNILDDKLEQIQMAMENEMKSITLKSFLEKTRECILNENQQQ